MIDARGLGKSFDQGSQQVTVFQDLALQIPDGGYSALVGASGQGKTTLLQILGCLDRPSRGTYLLDGVDVTACDEESLAAVRNQKIGFVFQTGHFIDYLSLVENVAIPGFYRHEGNQRQHLARARELLAEVGLSHRLTHSPATLSGGERQRAAIARALFNDPSLVLADEPTGSLDQANTVAIMEMLASLNRRGITLLVVTHDQYVANCADRIFQMSEGQLSALDSL